MEFWASGIHPFNSPLPEAQNEKNQIFFSVRKELVQLKRDKKFASHNSPISGSRNLPLSRLSLTLRFREIIIRSTDFFHPNFYLSFLKRINIKEKR